MNKIFVVLGSIAICFAILVACYYAFILEDPLPALALLIATSAVTIIFVSMIEADSIQITSLSLTDGENKK